MKKTPELTECSITSQEPPPVSPTEEDPKMISTNNLSVFLDQEEKDMLSKKRAIFFVPR